MEKREQCIEMFENIRQFFFPPAHLIARRRVAREAYLVTAKNHRCPHVTKLNVFVAGGGETFFLQLKTFPCAAPRGVFVCAVWRR